MWRKESHLGWGLSYIHTYISGQTKQFFGRNTETETGPSEKAEILAETEISADTLFWPK